ncbi:MAG: carbamoyltransferase N-terminal domain-containing protein, partial [Bacteroidota bacterium]
MTKILGISAYYHDSAAALLLDGQIVAAAQEERFSRKKHDADFPRQAIAYCLEESGLRLEDLDAIVFYDKPFLKFERLLETYYAFAPRGIVSFIQAVPVWLREKLFLKQILRRELGTLTEDAKARLPKLLFPEHHLSHAASAFYASPFSEAAILTVDGVGEWATATICHGKGKDISLLKELHFPHSLGLLYSAFTYFLGFKVNNGEYRLMGLAPFGDPESEQTQAFRQKIETELIDLKVDGSLWLNPSYFRYATSLRMIHHQRWERLFGFAKRQAESEIRQEHCNLALAIQQVTEEVVLRLAREAKRLTGLPKLCLAGGVALNSVANGRLERAGIFFKLFIQPAAGDAG